MKIVAQFDPSLTTSDTFNAGFPNGVGKMVVYNESNINLQLSWDAFTTYCPAWTAMLYCVTTNNVNISWEQQSTLASSGAPISMVIVEAYAPGESIMGTYPAPLVRQTNIGNASAVGGSATAIVNTGNPPLTPLITAQPSDATSATWNADTSGNLSISSDNAGTLTTLIQLIAGASPAVKLAAATVLTEVLGNMKVDGTLTAVGSSSLDNAAITTDGAGNMTALSFGIAAGTVISGIGNTHINAPVGNLDFDIGGASGIFIDSIAKMHFPNGFILNVGGMKDFNNGVNSAGTINHGLSGLPTAIIAECDSSPSTQTTGADSYTTTQFTLRTGAALPCKWIATR